MELASKPDWDRVRERWEAFWHGEIVDRPLVSVTAPRPGAVWRDRKPADADDALDWFTNPERVMARAEQQVANTYYAGDSFPLVFPVTPSMVAIEVAYLGAPYTLDPEGRTAWMEPIIDDWDNAPELKIDPDNFWWRRTQELLEIGAQRGVGRWQVGIPDLQGGGHVAVMLRGTQRIATDLYDNPEPVKKAIREVNEAWLFYYNQCFEIIHRYQDGWSDWAGTYSERPYYTVECDFAALISPRMFREFFREALELQTQWVERTLYHLDGPGQIPSLHEFLSIETLDGIQWIPGAGSPPMSEWIPLLQEIQRSGKLLQLMCEDWEVPKLLSELKPEGVQISTHCRTPEEADALMAEVGRRFGVKG